jgi:hypothetical protein
MATLKGREIDWFRTNSTEDEKNGTYSRLYVRFRLNGGGSGDRLIMLRNAYPETAPKLIYPNAVVITEGATVGFDIVVRGEADDVGCGFSIRQGISPGPSDKEMHPIADKLYAVGPAAEGPDAAARWRVDHVRRYQAEAKLIGVESLARLVTGNSTTAARAKLIPRSRCDIYTWPVKAYNDLDEGEAYSTNYLPPGNGQPPFGDTGGAKPTLLAEIDSRSSFAPSETPTLESPNQAFRRIEIQSELIRQRLGTLSVQLFVFDGSSVPPVGARGQPLSVQAKLAAAAPRGHAG